MKVHGRMDRRRPKRRGLDGERGDINNIFYCRLMTDEVFDRATWRIMPSHINPT